MRDEGGATSRAHRAAGIFIKNRISGAEIIAGQPCRAEIVLLKNRKGVFSICEPDLQLEVRAASALGAATGLAGDQRRYPLPGQHQLQAFYIPELAASDHNLWIMFRDLHRAAMKCL